MKITLNTRATHNTYIPFIFIYTVLGVFFYFSDIAFGIDAWLSLIFVMSLAALQTKLTLTIGEILLINLPLLAHNIGAYTLYSTHWASIGFDKYQHILSAVVATIIIGKLVYKQFKKTHRQYSLAVVILITISLVNLLGVGIELMEFGGHVLFGSGQGIMFTGEGDYLPLHGNDGLYVDTLTDILANLFGAVIGIGILLLTQWRSKKNLGLFKPKIKH